MKKSLLFTLLSLMITFKLDACDAGAAGATPPAELGDEAASGRPRDAVVIVTPRAADLRSASMRGLIGPVLKVGPSGAMAAVGMTSPAMPAEEPAAAEAAPRPATATSGTELPAFVSALGAPVRALAVTQDNWGIADAPALARALWAIGRAIDTRGRLATTEPLADALTRGDFEGLTAAQAYAGATLLDPRYAEALHSLGICCVRGTAGAPRDIEATAALSLLAAEHGKPESLMNWGSALLELGRPAEVIHRYVLSADPAAQEALVPVVISAHFAMVRTAASSGDRDAAMASVVAATRAFNDYARFVIRNGVPDQRFLITYRMLAGMIFAEAADVAVLSEALRIAEGVSRLSASAGCKGGPKATGGEGGGGTRAGRT